MLLTHGETKAHVDFKTARWGVHHDARRRKGIIWGELELAMIPAHTGG